MKFNELMNEQYNKGKAEGKAQTNQLIQFLLKQGRIDDLERSSTDPDFQNQLLEEFGLTDQVQ